MNDWKVHKNYHDNSITYVIDLKINNKFYDAYVTEITNEYVWLSSEYDFETQSTSDVYETGFKSTLKDAQYSAIAWIERQNYLNKTKK